MRVDINKSTCNFELEVDSVSEMHILCYICPRSQDDARPAIKIYVYFRHEQADYEFFISHAYGSLAYAPSKCILVDQNERVPDPVLRNWTMNCFIATGRLHSTASRSRSRHHEVIGIIRDINTLVALTIPGQINGCPVPAVTPHGDSIVVLDHRLPPLRCS